MGDLVEFLEARIAEDEQDANNHWRVRNDIEHSVSESGLDDYVTVKFGGSTHQLSRGQYRDEFCEHDPDRRLLAECAAKRAIVALHRRYEYVQHMVYGDIYPCTECGDVDDSPMTWPCPTLRHLAAVYADHPDYRQEWAV